jgi:CheY-like chemotaxis protein
VDDQPIMGGVVHDIFRDAGFEDVVFFENPKKAIEDGGQNKRPALVVTDCQMPEMTGLELLNKIEEIYLGINAVIMTVEPKSLASQPHRYPVPVFIKNNDFCEKILEIAKELIETKQ